MTDHSMSTMPENVPPPPEPVHKVQRNMKLCAYFKNMCCECKAGRAFRIENLHLHINALNVHNVHVATPPESGTRVITPERPTKRPRVDSPLSQSATSFPSNVADAGADPISLNDVLSDAAPSFSAEPEPGSDHHMSECMANVLSGTCRTLEDSHAWPLFLINQSAKTLMNQRGGDDDHGCVRSPLRVQLAENAARNPAQSEQTSAIMRKHVS